MKTSRCRRTGGTIACRAALLMIIAVLSIRAAAGGEGCGLPWSSLTLQAARLGSTATVKVEIEVLSAATESPKFLESPKGDPLQVSGPEVQRLSVTTTLDILGGRRIRLENHLWLDPSTNAPLYLVRTRFGIKDYHQQFRFTREGVFRRQREPATVGEMANPPNDWTRIGQNFYPYPDGRAGCPAIVETSQLVLLAEALGANAAGSLSPLCVFHKRQTHRVSVQTQPPQPVHFDYLEKRSVCENRRVGAVSVPGVLFTSRPIGYYRGSVEDFLRNGTRIYFSPAGNIPLLASGELPMIGRVEMTLKEVFLR
jgi:hypothetical protein